jgi:pimeloyl-ACP methyl ester carboxylesterase
MAQLTANGLQIEHDTFGNKDAIPLLLVMGLGAQMIHWRTEFCELLADAGHYVIRFDNRDVGLSEKLHSDGLPDIPAIMGQRLTGQPLQIAYTLDDMANDAFGVLDALELSAAHICGASMGGMIVQTMAINDPERVLTMTSIMSTTANPDLPPARPEAMAALMSPPGIDRDSAIERNLFVAGVIGSPEYRDDPVAARRRAANAYDRSSYTDGVARQMAAVIAADNRRPSLEKIITPTLVIHGKADPLVPVEGGIDTHESIKDSEILLFDGMGHDLPEALWEQIVENMSQMTKRT